MDARIISLPLAGAPRNLCAPALAALTTRSSAQLILPGGGRPGRWLEKSPSTSASRRISPSPFESRNSDFWQLVPSTSSAAAGLAWTLRDSTHHGRAPSVRCASGSSGKGRRRTSGEKGSGKSKGATSERNNLKKVEMRSNQNVWSADASGKSKSIDTGAGRERRAAVYSNGRLEDENVPNGGHRISQAQGDFSGASTYSRMENRVQQRGIPDDTVFLRFLSPNPPIEEEVVLQPEESVPAPVWSTFCGNTSGVWRGVGAAFSPETGDFEPISLNKHNKFLYDARVLSTVQIEKSLEDGRRLPSDQQCIHRRVLWAVEDLSSTGNERSQVARSDGQATDTDTATLFLAGEGDSEDEHDMEYWEADEHSADDGNVSNWGGDVPLTEEEDTSQWDLALFEPRGHDDRSMDGEDGGSSVEDDIELGSMWDEEEVIDNDWHEEGLEDVEHKSILVNDGSQHLSSASASSTPSTSESSTSPELISGSMWTEIMEEDDMFLDEGLVYFEDGSYSRGPFGIALNPSTFGNGGIETFTCKVEQCLVAGGHTRLRVVHTLSIENGERVEILRTAMYEEEWMGPANMKSISDVGGHRLKLFTERPRISAEDTAGSWKVFEIEGTSIHDPQAAASVGVPQGSFLFSCKETAIKRGFPIMPKLAFNDDDSVDLSALSMTWLPGNVSVCVNFSESGSLTFGLGWICENGIRLVVERVYGADGKLMHVKLKTEMKALVVVR